LFAHATQKATQCNIQKYNQDIFTQPTVTSKLKEHESDYTHATYLKTSKNASFPYLEYASKSNSAPRKSVTALGID